MIKRVLSRAYPSERYLKLYNFKKQPRSFYPDDYFQPEDEPENIKSYKVIRGYGRSCNSVCCTGYFIVETMLVVLINEDVWLLQFTGNTYGASLNKKMKRKLISKYATFQLPLVLAHYTKAVRDTIEVKDPKLKSLVIERTDIISR